MACMESRGRMPFFPSCSLPLLLLVCPGMFLAQTTTVVPGSPATGDYVSESTLAATTHISKATADVAQTNASTSRASNPTPATPSRNPWSPNADTQPKNWKVCSSIFMESVESIRYAQSLDCDIINGTFAMTALYLPDRYAGTFSFPTIRYVIGRLLLFARFETIRQILPNLVAVSLNDESKETYYRLSQFLLINNIDVPLEDGENVAMAVTARSFVRNTDGIAIKGGMLIYVTPFRRLYSPPHESRTPVRCEHGVPVATPAPENATAGLNDTLDGSGDAPPPAYQCCTRNYDRLYRCPNKINIGCFVTSARANAVNLTTEGQNMSWTVAEGSRDGTALLCTYYTGDALEQCADRCPNGTSLFQNSVCLPRCPAIVHSYQNSVEPYYSVYNTNSKQHECRRSCPPFFQADPATSVCQKCANNNQTGMNVCNRRCKGVVVKSLTQLCSFVGCTDVIGDLIININNPGLIPPCLHNENGITTLNTAMIRALGSVRRIYGYLLIADNICMYNLDFLRNLEDITVGKTISGQYRVLVSGNSVLTDVAGLGNLKRIGPNELKFLDVDQVRMNFRITSNSQLCNHQLDVLYERLLNGTSYTPVLKHEYTNADPRFCPINRFPITVTGVTETSIRIDWLLPQPSENTSIIYQQYLFYVETRNSVDPNLRDVIQADRRTEFSCAARLEPWSVITLPANATSYVVTDLFICSEFAFQIDVFYNRTGAVDPGVHIGNSSTIVLGRPKKLASPPSPGQLRVFSADRDTISLTWSEPFIACQALRVPFTYRVFWAHVNVYPPFASLSVDACGELCRCASTSFLDESTTIGQLMAATLKLFNGRILLSSGFPLGFLPNVPNLIAPQGCNNSDISSCCPEGLLVYIADRNLFTMAKSQLTRSRNFTIKRNTTTSLATYMFSVQAYHGSPDDSSVLTQSPWAVAANVTVSPNADTVTAFRTKVMPDRVSLNVSWTESHILNSPVIVRQALMMARQRTFVQNSSRVEDSLNIEITRCMMEYCATLTGHKCVNISLRLPNGTVYPVAVAANITTRLLVQHGRNYHIILPGIQCLVTREGGLVRDVLVQLRSVTLGGCGPWSPTESVAVTHTAEPPDGDGESLSRTLSANEIIGIVVAGVTLSVILLLSIYSISLREAKKESLKEAERIREMLGRLTQSEARFCMVDGGSSDELKIDIEPDWEWEVDLEMLSFMGELGHGNFGTVYEGRMVRLVDNRKDELQVAIKTVNPGSSCEAKREFLEEACIMKALNCPRLVNLVGIVTQGDPHAIMEYMPHGDLKHYLRAIRPEKQAESGFDMMVPPRSLFRAWAYHVAQGMEYLASKRLVHRDLAARNVMIDGKYELRVGDFGMSRDIYVKDYYRRESYQTVLPLRWLAPESIRDGVFSSASDVWAYGVVLYEMATLAEQPYVGLGNEEVVRLLVRGQCMTPPIPQLPFPKDVIRIMVSCWKHEVSERPTFTDLTSQLAQDDNCPYTELCQFVENDHSV